MNKGLKVAIAVGTFAVAFAVGGSIFFITNNSKKAEQSVKQYFDLLKDKDYEGKDRPEATKGQEWRKYDE